MGYIYKITNTKTGKMYVGQTAFSVERRWTEHKSKALKGQKNYLLYQAIRKCGVKSFVIETLEECDNSKLDEREIYWIKKLGTYGNGYNMTEGGDTNLFEQPTQEEINEWWQRFTNGESIAEISKTTFYHKCTISKYLQMHKEYFSIVKRNVKHKKKAYTQLRKNRRYVYVYDIDGNFIERIRLGDFKIDEIIKINNCAKGNRKSYKNKLYSYALLSKEDMKRMFDRFRKRKEAKKSIYDLIVLYKLRTLNKEEREKYYGEKIA